MPAFCTHYLFLEKTADYLKSSADFEFNFDAAAIGTQGPDIFFFHRIVPPSIFNSARKIGSVLHRSKPAEIFEAFSSYCKISNNPSIAKSYVYGFILHYSLDRNCHPYVYAMQEQILEGNRFLHKSSAHNRIEMAMDSYMLNKYKGYTNPLDFKSAQTITNNKEIICEIARLLAYVVLKIADIEISEKTIIQAVADTKRLQYILCDKSGAVKIICTLVEATLAPFIGFYKFSSMIKPKDLEKAKKYGNISNDNWISPYDKSRHNDSFEDLFNTSIDDAKKLIADFNSLCMGKVNGYEITKNISFLTGIEVK